MRVLVTGATSMIGDFLLPMLVDAGHSVIATSRREQSGCPGIEWIQVDLDAPEPLNAAIHAEVWIHLGSISLLTQVIHEYAGLLGVERVIAFSSTSRFTKGEARNSRDRHLARLLADGESKLEQICTECGIGWTIFRPTLIYCLGRDRNLTLVRNFIARFSFFPLIGGGCGLRQPVHAEDLAMACMQAMESRASINQAYDLSGGEILSYRDMVAGVFQSLEKHPRFLPIPLILMRIGIYLAKLMPRFRYLTPEMADRMSQDMVFSHEHAGQDFSYSPRSFQP